MKSKFFFILTVNVIVIVNVESSYLLRFIVLGFYVLSVSFQECSFYGCCIGRVYSLGSLQGLR